MNVGATGRVARSNATADIHCSWITNHRPAAWGRDPKAVNVGATGRVARSNSRSIVNGWGCTGHIRSLDRARRLFGLDASVHWTGRPDRSPLHFEKCFVDGIWRLCQFVKTSNESPEKGLPCTKIRVGDRGAPSRAICVFHTDGFFVCSLSFCLILPFLCFLPSVFSHGRTQYHTSGIVPLRALKNGDRGLFSYGRTTTTVRTRRYGGTDTSVRSQSQVLSMVKMGAKDAFSALERV